MPGGGGGGVWDMVAPPCITTPAWINHIRPKWVLLYTPTLAHKQTGYTESSYPGQNPTMS